MENLWRSAESWLWETCLGISTRGRMACSAEHGVHYATCPYRTIRRVLKELRLQPNDVVADVGCGKGRILAMARREPIARVVGIEYTGDLLVTARQNLPPRPGQVVDLIEGDARHVNYDGISVVILHNPFVEPVMREVFAVLADSLRRVPRRFQVAYIRAEHDDVLQQQPWLQCLHRYEQGWPEFPHRTTFYAARQ